ncbi:hypothetical protein FACS1894187_05290 [Synergistales bacterium]|nr:hypothetical protein FACS1894187_05290 [Synergistales bacterium]
MSEKQLRDEQQFRNDLRDVLFDWVKMITSPDTGRFPEETQILPEIVELLISKF